MRSYLQKSNFKFSLQEHHFGYVYEVIIKFYINFITCLYFPHALIRWNSSHCHLVEPFKSKKTCKEIFNSNNNSKTAWPRTTLEWHLFKDYYLDLYEKVFSFVGKHLRFYQKDVCSFSVFLILNEKVLNEQGCLIEYVENEKNSNSTSHKKRERRKT